MSDVRHWSEWSDDPATWPAIPALVPPAWPQPVEVPENTALYSDEPATHIVSATLLMHADYCDRETALRDVFAGLTDDQQVLVLRYAQGLCE